MANGTSRRRIRWKGAKEPRVEILLLSVGDEAMTPGCVADLRTALMPRSGTSERTNATCGCRSDLVRTGHPVSGLVEPLSSTVTESCATRLIPATEARTCCAALKSAAAARPRRSNLPAILEIAVLFAQLPSFASGSADERRASVMRCNRPTRTVATTGETSFRSRAAGAVPPSADRPRRGVAM